MLVYVPTFIHNQSQVIVLFQSGAGIEVLENQGQMSARLYLPLTFMVRRLYLTSVVKCGRDRESRCWKTKDRSPRYSIYRSH